MIGFVVFFSDDLRRAQSARYFELIGQVQNTFN